ncbi:phosphoglycerate mutase-like protein [Mycena rebaudengoi]|nr:phosphoglycerate mutase-like protein [Mycena rebaudengoi]
MLISAYGVGVLALFQISYVRSAKVSSFAGATSTFLFPPAGQTVTATDTFFPNPDKVGFAGPTPTGDEAGSIFTAPAIAKVDSVFPLINPATADKKKFDILHHLGNLAPWQSVDSFGLPGASPQVPKGCKLHQAHLLHRHGARYPSTGANEPSTQFATIFHQLASTTGLNVSGPLSFLETWEYKLGAEILTPFGRSQLFNLGVGFRVKYGELLKGFTDLPVFRTTSQGMLRCLFTYRQLTFRSARMVDSAFVYSLLFSSNLDNSWCRLHFAAGFFGVQSYQQDYHQLIDIEELGFNSTLAPSGQCPNSNNAIGNFGLTQALKWANVYLAAASKRLSPFITGLPLSPPLLLSMQQICAYETVSLGYSAFCDLFTEEEWLGYSYLNDLAFWYSFGPGNPTAAAQGIGYVQELVSRLTKTRITEFATTVNGTIVSSDVRFPLDQPIYVDATHDTVIAAVSTALNFTGFSANGPLPIDHIPPNHSYIISKIAPFASNLVAQVLSCPASATPTHIRFILNDGVIPLTGIKGCTQNANGLCPLPIFISAMKLRIQEVDFNFDCFANYTIPDPDNITNGQFPK